MFGLFGRSRPKAARSPSRRANLSLEALEERYCLTGPTLTAFSAQTQPGHVAVLSGNVTASFMQGIRVNFSGAVSGNTITDANGNFSYATQNASQGIVSAVAIDYMNFCSIAMTASVTAPAPSLTLSFSYLSEGNIQLTGSVSDLDPGPMTVTFSGVAYGSTSTNQYGAFSFITKPTSTGTINAITTDLWGNTSNTATVSFNPSAPVVSNFTGTQGLDNSWTFSGTVTAPEAPKQLVQLSGLPELTSKTVIVLDNGTFSVQVYLLGGVHGQATALSNDWWGQNSNQATFSI